ncbi:MAG TPA: YCF48-related protein [Saprospiraceae bacterium]
MNHLFKISIGFILLFNCISADAQWIRQYPLAKLEHVVDIVTHEDGHGFAVGGDDLILRLNGGSNQWDLLTSWDGGWSLESVDYLEGTFGQTVAAGGQGLILSQNGGDSWTEIADAPGGIFTTKVISATDIVVVGDEGVFRWHNNTWDDLNLPVTSGVAGGFILDDQHIWCFTNGTSPVVYSTSNGGTSWNMNTQIDRPDVIKFYDIQYGIAFDSRTVYQSLNGGQTWEEVSNNAIHNSINDFTFGDSPNVLMAATFNGVPTISIDSGLTWTQKDLGLINERNYSIEATSDSEFWVGNDLSSVTLTTDAGDTWIETSGPDRQIMNDIFFLDRNFGFAVGTDGTLLRTTSGGSQWEDISFGETRPFLSVHGLAANDLWMGANQRIYHSSDMGDTWQEKAALLGFNTIDVLAVNANIVLACSPSGIILRSIDAGTSWDTVYQTSGQIRSLSKIDNQRYMATGFNGVILRSANQGATWTPLAAPEAGLQYEQTQFIGNEGWMVTSSFKKTMWHTTNAGDTWNPITLPIERFWDGLYFISPDTGIVVGRSNAEGRVYITFNGGANWQAGYITDFPLFGVTGIPNPNGTAWIFGFGSDIEVLPYCSMLPVISNLSGENTPCENDTVTYSITSQDVEQFQWLFPTGWQIQGNPNNDTVRVKVGRNSGTISVTGLNDCGFSSPVSMSAGPILLPVITNLTGDNSPCESELKTYFATSSDIQDFVWTFPGPDWLVNGQSNADEVSVFVGETPGNIIVHGSNSCGDAQFQILVIPDLRPRMYAVSGAQNPCEGDTVEYAANGEFYEEVTWTYPADWVVIGSQNESIIELIAGATDGVVSAAGVNPCGTSAIQEFQVSPIDVPEIEIIAVENFLSLTGTGLTYQWYHDGIEIPGATGPEYTATVTGVYTAGILFVNGCFTITSPVNIIIASVGHRLKALPITVYPTPVSEHLYIKGIENSFTYTITDMSGALVASSTASDKSINVSALSEGVYILRIEQDAEVYMARFVVERN